MKLLKKRKRKSGSRKPDPRSTSSRNDGDLGADLTPPLWIRKRVTSSTFPPRPASNTHTHTRSRTLTGIILAPKRIEAGGAGSGTGTGTNDWGLGRRSGLPSFPRNLLQEAVRIATLSKWPRASWPVIPAKPRRSRSSGLCLFEARPRSASAQAAAALEPTPKLFPAGSAKRRSGAPPESHPQIGLGRASESSALLAQDGGELVPWGLKRNSRH